MQECSQALKICKSLWAYLIWGWGWGVGEVGVGVGGLTSCVCSIGPFRLRWLKDICITHVIIIIKSEVSTLPLSYFSVFVCLRCLLHYFLLLIAYTFRENRDFVFIIIVQFMMVDNSRIRYGFLIVFDCLYITPSHYHHCANLSEDIELIKCLSDIFCRVCE